MVRSKVIPFPSSYRRRECGARVRPGSCKIHVLATRRHQRVLAYLPLRALKEFVLCAVRVVGA